MLRRDDRLDDVGDIVYIRQGLYAKEDVVKRLLGRMGGIFGGADDCEGRQLYSGGKRNSVSVPAWGLNRSLP
jgi:hypothetical protein